MPEVKPISSADDLTLDPANVNKGTERGKQILGWSVAELGAGRSILVDADGVVIAGNKTLEEARALGIPIRVVQSEGQELVVVQRTDLALLGDGKERDRARQLALADNRASEVGYELDIETLLAHTQSGVDLAALYSTEEIDALLASITPDVPNAPGGGGDDFDVSTEDDKPVNIRPGDLWELGNHRIFCGDSTNAQHVAQLMGEKKADACFTSPPYDQQRTYEGNMASDWRTLVSAVMLRALDACKNEAQFFVNLGLVHRDGRVIRYWDGMITDIEAAGVSLFGWYIWDKLDGMPGDWNGRLAPAHEWIFHFTRTPERPEKIIESKCAGQKVGRTQRNADGSLKEFTSDDPIQTHKIPDSVIRIGPQKPDPLINEHPAPFPIGLPSLFIQAWPSAALWYEPFSGSGTSLIACERLNRSCYGMEIEPKYVDVIIRRWEAETGRTARLLSRAGVSSDAAEKQEETQEI